MESLSSDLVQLRLQPVNLVNLPRELLARICDYLTWPELVNLRLTSLRIATGVLGNAELAPQHQRCESETLMREYELSKGLSISEIGWPRWTLTSAHDTLPCYRCLHWKPSADRDLKSSAFSRTKSVAGFDIGMRNAAQRICIECGIRSGFYGKGCRIGYWLICQNCHVRLSKESCGSRTEPKNCNADWKDFKYCQTCISNGGLPETMLQWQHQVDWGKYEQGMWEGKMYRLQKGRLLRKERGIQSNVNEVPSEADGKKAWTCCPLRNMRQGLCNCQRQCQPPYHVRRLQLAQWWLSKGNNWPKYSASELEYMRLLQGTDTVRVKDRL